jgi:hypothetical protein
MVGPPIEGRVNGLLGPAIATSPSTLVQAPVVVVEDRWFVGTPALVHGEPLSQLWPGIAPEVFQHGVIAVTKVLTIPGVDAGPNQYDSPTGVRGSSAHDCGRAAAQAGDGPALHEVEIALRHPAPTP